MDNQKVSSSQKASPLKKYKNEIFAKYYAEEGKAKRPVSETVNKSPAEVFNLLQNLDNFALFFENLEKVEKLDAQRATWYFKNHSPTLKGFSVPMKIEFDRNNHGLIWKAEDGAGFNYSVAIELEPAQAGRGTIVRMMVAYDNLVGEIGGFFAKLFGQDAEVLSKKNLQRLKAFCETGHVPTIEGQPSGRDEDQSPEMKH